jgi:hypothetical protein
MFPERPRSSCVTEGVKMQLHGQVEKSDKVILSVDCRVSRVCSRKFSGRAYCFDYKLVHYLHVSSFGTVYSS